MEDPDEYDDVDEDEEDEHPEPEVTIEVSGLSLLHARGRDRGRARGGSAAAARPPARRRRVRRDRHRPDRGHGRLRPGVRHREPRGAAAHVQDARAAVRGDRRPAARAATTRTRCGSRPPSPSRRWRCRSARYRSRCGARPNDAASSPRHGDRTVAPRVAMTRGFLGLGSNVGDRRAHLEAAVAALPTHGVDVVASSSVYETEPVGLVLDQRDFYNACLRVDTAHGPEQLLTACKDVERELGRPAGGVRHGPRPIDVDVLLLDELEYRLRPADAPAPRGDVEAVRARPAARARPGPDAPGRLRLADALAALAGGQDVRRAGPPLL